MIHIAPINGVSVNPQKTCSYAASCGWLPGAFASDMNRVARDHGDEVAQRIPAGLIGTPEDIAGAAIYLASRVDDYVMGAALVVDGGVAWAR